MKRLLALAGLVAALIGGLAPATATDRPVLRSEVRTLSEIVTVGDFYLNAGLYADVPLFRSPDLGTSGDVPAEVVARRAQAAGLVTAGTDGLFKVVVHRRAEIYDRDSVKTMVQNALAGQDAALLARDIEITMFQAPATIHADPAAEEPVRVGRILWSRNDGRFTVHLDVAGKTGTHPVKVTGLAKEMVEVAALLQPLRRGAILKPEDVTAVRLPRNNVPARALQDAAELIGLAARNNLRANTPLRRNDFERPTVVPRGEKVTITYQLPGMKLTTRGQAMEDGAAGDPIDIMNLQSRQIVTATVVSRGQVRIEPVTPLIASLNKGAQQ